MIGVGEAVALEWVGQSEEAKFLNKKNMFEEPTTQVAKTAALSESDLR